MDSIRTWILGACFAALACSLMELLCPAGKMQKSARTVTAVFFLCAVLLPASKALKNISFITTSAGTVSAPEELMEKVESQSREIAQNSVGSLIANVLRQHDVAPVSVQVEVDADDDGTIGIRSARVGLKSDDYGRADEIRSWIYAQLGIVAECYAAE